MTSRGAAIRALLIAALACAGTAYDARAHDSRAPTGALHAWLPETNWVIQHWLPFDETRLHAALGIDNLVLERWLRNDHRTIAELARRRTGTRPRELARELVAPWAEGAGPERVRVLERRAVRVLTQGHLAQHLLYHPYHGTFALRRTRRIFGLPRRAYLRLRDAGLTPIEAAREGGRSRRHVAREMRRLLKWGAVLGVAREAHSAAQAAQMLGRRGALLGCFLNRPVPKFDPGNPYGDPNNGHGPHARATRNGLRRNSKQRRARAHPRSCWQEPRLGQSGAGDIPGGPPRPARDTAEGRDRPRGGRAGSQPGICALEV